MFLRGARPPSLPAPLPLWPSYRQVRRFCRGVVRAAGAEPPLEVEALCTAVGRLRGRPIEVRYRALPPGMFGFSFAYDKQTRDYVVVAANTTRMHQEHIVLHELGHILAGHIDGEATTAGDHTGDHDAAREREWTAESIAVVLAERALLHTRRFGERPADPGSRALDDALRGGGAWI
ncbi:ImmA/IrrE family metallo-endopeptidase [Pseudonocardia sp. N23]|uniref:ImmA/IrrE family metallo-endopeptidase n=1 Tax=Pseudonocardia sp. N23 TaxID=1987376 RepID=UPI00209C0A53|nr:ImmA/IrrE family metallo-endopeptidase [Pseudonocardia sp. N23]